MKDCFVVPRLNNSLLAITSCAMALILLNMVFPINLCADTDIAAVEKPFLEGRYEKAAQEAGKLIDQRARQRYELYYLKGLSELKLNKYSEAMESFTAIISKYPNSGRGFDAYIGSGDSFLLSGDSVSARRQYEEALRRYPDDKNTAVAHARLKECSAPSDTPPPAVNAAGPDTASDISVQAGCFKNRRNAEKFVAELAHLGYDSYIGLPVADGDALYRVKVGRLKSEREADDLAARLKKDGYNTKICENSPA